VDDFESSLNDLLVDTFFSILKFESASLKSLAGMSVTIAEAHMIDCIARQNGQATVSQVASGMQLAIPTATATVKKLESKGYVTKVPCEDDARRSYIRLTDLGRRVDRAHTLFHQRMVRNISAQLEGPEKEILLMAIKKLSVFFGSRTKAAQ